MTGINWSRRKRPAAARQGHDIRRTGETEPNDWYRRYYLECECGKTMSALGDFNGPFYAWSRHRRDLGLDS